MQLEHFSGKPLIVNPKWPYLQAATHKPHGLWVSVKGEDDWPHWCADEDYRPDKSQYVTQIEVDLSRILVLDTVDKIDSFTRSYLPDNKVSQYSYIFINWHKVSEEYDGIIIAPYQWDARYGVNVWYYGWDAASGCIWNLDAITRISESELFNVEELMNVEQ